MRCGANSKRSARRHAQAAIGARRGAGGPPLKAGARQRGDAASRPLSIALRALRTLAHRARVRIQLGRVCFGERKTKASGRCQNESFVGVVAHSPVVPTPRHSRHRDPQPTLRNVQRSAKERFPKTAPTARPVEPRRGRDATCCVARKTVQPAAWIYGTVNGFRAPLQSAAVEVIGSDRGFQRGKLPAYACIARTARAPFEIEADPGLLMGLMKKRNNALKKPQSVSRFPHGATDSLASLRSARSPATCRGNCSARGRSQTSAHGAARADGTRRARSIRARAGSFGSRAVKNRRAHPVAS